MSFSTVRLKALIPGYRAKWRRSYACMLAELTKVSPRLRYGQDDGVPWIEHQDDGLRFYGYLTEPGNAEIFDLLRKYLPADMPKEHYRLVKDYLNRFVYPHSRPDLKPVGYPTTEMFGFHGQHKDTIHDYEDVDTRPRLFEAFAPKPDEIIIDCGAFLGFGDMHLSPLIGDGGRIYAVEADPDCAALLKRNLEHNTLQNVELLWNAVFNKDGESVELKLGFAQGNTLFDHLKKTDETIEVSTITIDTIQERFGIERVDMISLTLNGAEPETVDGAMRVLQKFRPRLRAAGWYTRDGVKIWEILKQKLEPIGYQVFVGPRGSLLALPEEAKS